MNRRPGRTPAYRDRLGARAYERLAAEVLLSALSDYMVYHSEPCKRLRIALAQFRRNGFGRVEPGEAHRLGVRREYRDTRLMAVAQLPDPADFLCSSSPFHSIADVDPETMRKVLADPERIAQVRTALAAGKKKGPRARKRGSRRKAFTRASASA